MKLQKLILLFSLCICMTYGSMQSMQRATSATSAEPSIEQWLVQKGDAFRDHWLQFTGGMSPNSDWQAFLHHVKAYFPTRKLAQDEIVKLKQHVTNFMTQNPVAQALQGPSEYIQSWAKRFGNEFSNLWAQKGLGSPYQHRTEFLTHLKESFPTHKLVDQDVKYLKDLVHNSTADVRSWLHDHGKALSDEWGRMHYGSYLSTPTRAEAAQLMNKFASYRQWSTDEIDKGLDYLKSKTESLNDLLYQ